jgi:hypothetical protein
MGLTLITLIDDKLNFSRASNGVFNVKRSQKKYTDGNTTNTMEITAFYRLYNASLLPGKCKSLDNCGDYTGHQFNRRIQTEN